MTQNERDELTRCGYCGGKPDHKHGTGHACGDCCSMHGMLTFPEVEEGLHKWVGEMFRSRVVMMSENQRMRELLQRSIAFMPPDVETFLPPGTHRHPMRIRVEAFLAEYP